MTTWYKEILLPPIDRKAKQETNQIKYLQIRQEIHFSLECQMANDKLSWVWLNLSALLAMFLIKSSIYKEITKERKTSGGWIIANWKTIHKRKQWSCILHFLSQPLKQQKNEIKTKLMLITTLLCCKNKSQKVCTGWI